ncbi:MAG: enoyl-CoA hydratase-related protein [Steroidobacteraceae bacterium]
MIEPTAWTLERDADDIAWLTLDRPGGSANTLGAAVLEELDGLLAGLESRPPRGLVLRSGKASGFIAGADVTEFTRVASAADALALIRRGQRVIARLEALPCPSVAAIHGFALGGGLELALGCHYRVGVADGRLALGLPEVQLGIHPGFGGTVRAVRTLGVRAAMALMLAGQAAARRAGARPGAHRPPGAGGAARRRRARPDLRASGAAARAARQTALLGLAPLRRCSAACCAGRSRHGPAPTSTRRPSPSSTRGYAMARSGAVRPMPPRPNRSRR